MFRYRILSSVLLFLVLVNICSANTFLKEGNIHITNLHRIEDDLYLFGETATIDGEVTGDVSAFTYNFINNGEIGHSLNAFAFSFNHRGKIHGSLRTFTNYCSINSFIAGSALLINNETTIGSAAVIEKDVNIYGNKADIEGVISGNFTFNGEHVKLSGEIGGDVVIEANQIELISPLIIHGNLNYIGDKELSLNSESGIIIEGETTWKAAEKKDSESKPNTTEILITISEMFAAFILGIILIWIFRRYAESSFNQLNHRTGQSFASGIITMLIVIFSTVVLVFALLGFIIGLMVVSGEAAILGTFVLVASIIILPITGFITVAGGILFYTGKILMAVYIGYFIISRLKRGAALLSKSQLFLGLIILTLLVSIPYIGSILYIVAGLFGTGAIVLGVRKCKTILDNTNKTNVSMDNGTDF